MNLSVAANDRALNVRALDLLRSALVWDNHACLPLRPGDETFLPEIERFRAVGADVVSVNVGYGEDSLDAHIRMLAAFRSWFAARPDQYVLVETVGDIDAARASGRLAVTFDMEGTAPLNGGDHGLIELFYDLGVRWMLFAYNRNTRAGGGCHDDDTGLTPYGREVLREMTRVGMVPCCSHTGRRTAGDVLAQATGPVIFSHSNPSALTVHPRNISDDLIRGCAATGGVVGINGIGRFLGGGDLAAAVVRHIDYVAELVGPDHVGVALDYVFDQEELAEALKTRPQTFPAAEWYAGDFEQLAPEGLIEVVSGLLALGYPETDIAKILGGNWRRVAEAAWK